MPQNPGMSRGVLRRRVKLMVAADDSETRLEHAKNLPHQGELLRDTPDSVAAKVWSLAVGNLTSTSLKFILNAATDTVTANCGEEECPVYVHSMASIRHSFTSSITALWPWS